MTPTIIIVEHNINLKEFIYQNTKEIENNNISI